MTSRPPFLDSRLERDCVYCGGRPNTKDHVPSRILLDEPFPDNLPSVKSCLGCNNGFSANEEYFATLIECVMCGSVNPEEISREKIKNVLRTNRRLAEEIKSGCRGEVGGTLHWTYDAQKVRDVVLKLARGHVAFEDSTPQLDEPSSIAVFPLASLEPHEMEIFENACRGEFRLWPELGSRAFERLFTDGNNIVHSPWITVQRGRYRYTVDIHAAYCVRIVLSEYLGCEVIWSE